ncbi:hypothetical protein [Dactylosporangium matsuzakiense]|uniref:Uncharacterized protein n=1 Tax=Dactylosporangium matsuzakiense TaxID=53360 RepID=A0A9W6KM90_9ACTN|nr:hypothetical protein [Dactylosporangium matsuzakiense]GLL02856.1 hypothetical protein GCM10017581_045980 [Dactylosporangium matsuzakiense]
MFDLFKDVAQYNGVPPYASELYGVYQPLLGWRSALTQKWLQGPAAPDPRIRRILDARIQPGPIEVDPDHSVALPLAVGNGRSPYRVYLAKELNSEVVRLVRDRVQQWADDHQGALPIGAQWRQLINVDDLMEPERGILRRANDIVRARLWSAVTQSPPDKLQSAIAAMRAQLLDRMQYESQIAALLVFYAEGQSGYSPADLAKLYAVKEAAPLADVFAGSDPLADIDPRSDGGALSPVGMVHLFRQYFFDLGTFLGEAVEHVWLAPGTTLELMEISTRRTLVEQTTEQSLESTIRSERAESSKDEYSQAVKEQNQTSTKLGVSQSNTVNAYVYQGTVSASFGVESTRSSAREETHKRTHEVAEKVAGEIKQSYKSVFRTVTETTDTRSRRYLLTNPGTELVNYELRRKMRRVGVQLQDIGSRLCWQVFVDDPGAVLGLGDLVHVVSEPDLSHIKEPEKLPAPATITKKVVVPLGFQPLLDYWNNKAQYEYETFYEGRHIGHIWADEDDDDSQIVIEFGPFTFEPPQTGYKFRTSDIRLVNVQGNKMAALRNFEPVGDNAFKVIMQRLNFGGENQINLEVELVYDPTDDERKRVDDANKAAAAKYDQEKAEAIRLTYVNAVRQRITDARGIAARPSWDLRDEERTVVYRRLIEQLMLDTWKTPDGSARRRTAHVRSEIVRSLFDIDSMLYFVAPEWWLPRQAPEPWSKRIPPETPAGQQPAGLAPLALAAADTVGFGGVDEKRAANYPITEQSKPAKLGSSLGWLLQLDGDNLRNAFLNAPWVKAVIPIRPGREQAALNWLKAVEGSEGWDGEYLGEDDPEFVGKTIGEVLDIVADRLAKANGAVGQTLAADRVFEHGFDHLAAGFDATLPAQNVFSQWLSIVPTDQIVAQQYEPTDLTKP